MREQPDVDVGQIGIFTVNNDGFIKKKGEDRLISINDDYPDIRVGEYDDCGCAGLVIGRLERSWVVDWNVDFGQ